jgi:GMP synthase-like glutamine amidotransferase
MRMHYLQHVEFEGPAAIEEWAKGAGHLVTASHLYWSDALPEPAGFDLLVLLGGPMSINEEREYPWLTEEKQLIRRAMEAGRAVFGVCLGAQMIANAMGARVY